MRAPSWQQFYAIVRVVAPPTFANLVLTVLILIPAVADAIGDNAFLVLTYLHLFFFPEGPVGDHIEKTIIHLAICAVGLAITFVFVCVTVYLDGNAGQPPYSTIGSKALGACVLALWCFFGGLCESRFPRIKFAMRILLFSTTWTICTGASRINSAIFTQQFYPAALAAGVSLLANLLVFPHGAESDFARVLVKLYGTQRAVLKQTVNDFFKVPGAHSTRRPSPQLVALRKELVEMTNELKDSFESASVEITYGRLAITEAKPLVASIKRSRGWISCGMGLGTREGHEPAQASSELDESLDAPSASTAHEDKLMEPLRPCIFKLLETIDSSIAIVGASIELTMNGGSPRKVKAEDRWKCLYTVDCSEKDKKPALTLSRQRNQMAEAIEAFKSDLAFVLKQLADSSSSHTAVEAIKEGNSIAETTCGHHVGAGLFCSDIYDAAFLMVSLMEMAKEVTGDLLTCQSMVAHWHTQHRKRVWLPSIGISFWIRSKLSRESQTGFVFHNDEMDAIRRELLVFSETEKMAQDMKEKEHSGPALSNRTDQFQFIRWRIKASKAISFLKHSIHVHYALKLSAGAVLLSLPSWMTETRSWFEHERGIWIVITYIWVLETNSGATIRVSIYRTIATISSAIYAIVAWYICNQGNRYAIGLFIILAELPACYFILFTKHAQSLGLVFAFTQSVILFYPFTSGYASDYVTVAHLGLIRGYQILLGIAAAFLVNIFVWPLHARVFLLRTISHVTAQCSTEYLSLARQMLNNGVIVGPETSRKFAKLEDNIQVELLACHQYLEIMHVELSLVPKPIHTLSLVLKTLQRVADLLVLLRKCREVALRIIQKESCFNVLNLRKELVSNLLLSFWIVGQSLVTKEPMPQFLPSCREALVDLTEAMRGEIDSNVLKVRTVDAGSKSHESDIATAPVAATFSIFNRRRHRQGQSGQSTPRQQKVIDYSYFFVFAEHTLLSEIIFEVEKLLYLTKMLVGESSFIDSHYLPRHDYFVESADANVFHHSMTEHGIDGRRLISQLDAQLRAAKAEAAVARAIRSEE